MISPRGQPPSGLREIVLLFLKLGATAFGGPAAHVAMMRDEVVTHRKWLSDREFLDLVAATNLIPGPNSTELAIHIGHRQAGWPGLLVAGAAFILPATLIVGAIAWAYVHYGARPDVRNLFYGIGPVVIAIVAHALWGMARTAVKSWWLLLVVFGAFLAYANGAHELEVLAGSAIAGWFSRAIRGLGAAAGSVLALLAIQARLAFASPVTDIVFPAPIGLGALFGVFFKAGALLFGSGYVLIAFLRSDLVENHYYLTESQLLDAIAVGQFTPGPVFSTATFIGYILAGPSGAVVATVAIFLPAFIYVAASAPFIARLRSSPTAGSVLDAVTVGSLALMAVVTIQLSAESLTDATTVSIALVSLGLLLTTRVNSAWLVGGGAVVGVLWRAL